MDPQVTASKIHGQVASYLSDFAGKAGAHRDVLEPDHKLNPDLDAIADKLWKGEAHINDLGRGYKLAPHAPPGLLFKYIVHRANNIDGYDNSISAHTLDHSFFQRHASGGAKAHHTKITTRHLNEWLSLNPQLVDEALHNRNNLQQMVKRGIGLNVRTINSEPHVAMTRGLDTNYVGEEHALSSFADLPHSGYGSYQHHIWMPVSDLWYAFPTTPAHPRGIHGHENEWLFAQQSPRYEAQSHEVKSSWAGLLDPSNYMPEGNIIPGEIPAIPYDDIDPAYLDLDASALTLDQLEVLHAVNRMGAGAYKEYRNRGGSAQSVADLPFMEAGEARALAEHQLELGDPSILAFHNPNLSSGDLVNLAGHPNFIPPNDLTQATFRNYLRSIVKNPNFNSDVADKIMERIENDKLAKHAVLLARYSPVPVRGLHRFLLGGLSTLDDISWSPEFAIANAFNNPDSDNPATVPSAFNNSANTDQYLRALTHFYKLNPDETDSASEVYKTMLKGARLSESMATSLVELEQAAKPLPGLDLTEHRELLEHTARFNEQLSTRAMMALSKSESGRVGLLQRDELPDDIQVALADEVDDDDQVSLLIHRPDLSPRAADKLLFHAQNLDGQTADEDDLIWLGSRIANNEAVPMTELEKHLTQDAKNAVSKYADEQEVPPVVWTHLSPVEQGIMRGMFNRKSRAGLHTVHPLSPGALS